MGKTVRRRRKTLGEILKEHDWVTEEQIQAALQKAKAEGKVIGAALLG